MNALHTFTVAAGLVLFAGSASADNGAGPFALLGLGALGIGALAGLVCGYRGLSHGVGLGSSLLFVFVATFIFIAFLGGIVDAAFWTIVMVPLVGLLPLAVAYFPLYALSASLKRHFAPPSPSDAKSPPHEH